MDRLVAYISHPLGEDGFDGPMRDNLSNCAEWARFFLARTQYVLLCPWYFYAIIHSDPLAAAPRRLVDSLVAIERSDVLLQCGGVLNPHMVYEAKAAKRVGTPIADLTSFGVLPPATTSDYAEAIIARIKRTVLRQPRRVWMPLLTTAELDQMKKARHALYAHLPGEHEAAVALLDRILDAAHEEEG